MDYWKLGFGLGAAVAFVLGLFSAVDYSYAIWGFLFALGFLFVAAGFYPTHPRDLLVATGIWILLGLGFLYYLGWHAHWP